MLPRISDSNYVPLSATQAPVTGLTDILTPVNLLPNSDFSRSGGYKSPITISSLSNGNSRRIADNWIINATSGNYTNITVTRSTESLLISGTVDSSDGSLTRLGLYSDTVPSKNHTYTIQIIRNEIVNCNAVATIGGSHNTIYTAEDLSIQIVTANATNNTAGAQFYINEGTNVQFSVKITGIALYEGLFKNPSYIKGLDVLYSNVLMNTNMVNRIYYTIDKADNNNHWFRIAKLGGYGLIGQPGGSSSSQIMLWKGYAVRPWKHSDAVTICEIDVRIVASKPNSGNAHTGYSIKGTRANNSSGNESTMLKQWRIGLSYEYSATIPEIYLETYMSRSGSSEGNMIFVIPETSLCSMTYLGFQEKLYNNLQFGNWDVIGDNDIMIGSEYTIEDISSAFTWPDVS